MTTTNFQCLNHLSKFTIRTHTTSILKTNKMSTHEFSIGRWSQELGLTRYANQELPIIYGANTLEIHHQPSNIHISFCALEALRSWAYLNAPPVPHKAKGGPPSKWDYTFTTNYKGSITRSALGTDVPARPNATSVSKFKATQEQCSCNYHCVTILDFYYR
jgi:hypothetical protein